MRAGRFAVFWLALCAAASASTDELRLTQQVIETGLATHQVVVTGRFTQNQAQDVVVFNRLEDRTNRLLLYQRVDDVWQQTADLAFPDDVIFVDVITIAEADQLLAYRDGELFTVALPTLAFTPLLVAPSIFHVPAEQGVTREEVVVDVDADGRDDVLVPNFDGYGVWRQMADGTFAPMQTLDAAPLFLNEYGPAYVPKRPLFFDDNQDGLQDVGFWDPEGLQVYRQRAAGGFDEGRLTQLPVDVALEEGVAISMGEEDQSQFTEQMLYGLEDYDGDDVADLVVYSLYSESVFGKSTAYSVFPGAAADGTTQFAVDPSTEIRSDGIQFNPVSVDFNDDGAEDLALFSVEIGIRKIVGALFTGSVRVDLLLYAMEDGAFPPTATLRKRVDFEVSWTTGEVLIPSFAIADISGDGVKDLLVQHGREALDVFLGSGQRDAPFADKPRRFKLTMPDDPGRMRVQDLDGDGRNDLLLRFPSRREVNRMSVVLSG